MAKIHQLLQPESLRSVESLQVVSPLDGIAESVPESMTSRYQKIATAGELSQSVVC
jgi:hypothetical protein